MAKNEKGQKYRRGNLQECDPGLFLKKIPLDFGRFKDAGGGGGEQLRGELKIKVFADKRVGGFFEGLLAQGIERSLDLVLHVQQNTLQGRDLFLRLDQRCRDFLGSLSDFLGLRDTFLKGRDRDLFRRSLEFCAPGLPEILFPFPFLSQGFQLGEALRKGIDELTQLGHVIAQRPAHFQ